MMPNHTGSPEETAEVAVNCGAVPVMVRLCAGAEQVVPVTYGAKVTDDGLTPILLTWRATVPRVAVWLVPPKTLSEPLYLPGVSPVGSATTVMVALVVPLTAIRLLLSFSHGVAPGEFTKIE